MDWNRQQVLALIEAYRKRSVIWDTKNSLHYNQAVKQAAWEDLGQEVQKPAKECKKKMMYLMSALRREKMKMKRSRESGDGKVYSSSWFAFESLKFLWEKNKQVQLLVSEQTPNKECKNEVGSSKALPVKRPPSRPDSHPVPKKKARTNFSIHSSAHKIQAPTTTSTNQQEDESYHFGKLVALKLRTYNDNVRCAIQNDIMGVFLRASQGFYQDIFGTSIRECDPVGRSPSYHRGDMPVEETSSDSVVSIEESSAMQLSSEVTEVKLELE